MLRNLFLLLTLLSTHFLYAQIVSIDPPFPTVDDNVTITYDATQGNGDLAGITPVYIHSGVITTAGGAGNWQYVFGDWGSSASQYEMTDIGNNQHQMSFNIRTFYGVPTGEEVVEMAFVFRNADGSIEGKTAAGGDIFVSVYQSGTTLNTAIATPTDDFVFAAINDVIPITGNASVGANLSLYDNGNLIASASGTSISHNLTVSTTGNHTVILEADDGNTMALDSFKYIVNPAVNIANQPAGTLPGLNEVNSSTLRLSLYAPFKDFVYVIGDFNDWTPDVNYYMNRDSDGETWWLDISGLTPGQEYAFQYFVDGEIRVADPYSEKILDQYSDGEISGATYPNLKPYPVGQTTNAVTAFTLGEAAYNWQINTFSKPKKTDLVVYELLVRDFLVKHDFKTLKDSLDYLQKLGVNAIELMPVSEFEGNNSWGYNISFHMALDKYYGPADDFKALVDEAHARGIAVILDVVYNHAFSQSPLCQLYWDQANFKPAPGNPWLNVNAAHPYNVGYDFNHASTATEVWRERVMQHWINEFKIDGFRFDLSKGFTQNFTTDVGVWGQYDASRIAIVKDIADACWEADPDFFVILEHFAENSEEIELANYDMMIWGSGHGQYNEASMGYSSDLSTLSYQSRGWIAPNLVGFMESHDEERLMYKNLQFGNSSGSYDITDLNIALARQELVAAFFFTIPGPKSMWEFGELGYDYSINTCINGTIDPSCRLDPKPIRWDYLTVPARKQLHDVYQSLIHLKKEYNTFETSDFQLSVSGFQKRIRLNHPDMDAIVLGNFDVVSGSIDPQFQYLGWWYEYFSGDSLLVSNIMTPINLQPGEYRIYTSQNLDNPISVGINSPNFIGDFDVQIAPNPANQQTHIQYTLAQVSDVHISVVNPLGQTVDILHESRETTGTHDFDWDTSSLSPGLYFLRLDVGGVIDVQKLVIRR